MSSKYPVMYQSLSKKGPLNIEEMATPHLIHAWRKLRAEVIEDADAQREHAGVVHSMALELRERGGIYDHSGDQWIFPPKEEPKHAAGCRCPKCGGSVSEGYNDPAGDDSRVGS